MKEVLYLQWIEWIDSFCMKTKRKQKKKTSYKKHWIQTQTKERGRKEHRSAFALFLYKEICVISFHIHRFNSGKNNLLSSFIDFNL